DPRLREVLLPDYPIGGKRILISDDYYQALGRANVEVVTDGIDHVREDAVVGRDGRVHAVDAIILATGFESTAFLAPMAIEGAAGRRLDAVWADGARAYRGITVAGFPNFFMMYGPNTNLGHHSIIFMLECQTPYIVEAIETLRRRGPRCWRKKSSIVTVHDDGQRVWFCEPSVYPRGLSAKFTSASGFVPHPGSQVSTCCCEPSMMMSVNGVRSGRSWLISSSPFGQMPAMSHA